MSSDNFFGIQEEKNDLIRGLLNSVLRKKLEDVVLDTMDHPEQVPIEILEYRDLAREYGFDDILVGIDEIFREIGEIQVSRKLQRRYDKDQKRLEKAMQDFFIVNDGKELEQFEPGLKYIRHEKITRAGRLDIYAEDKDSEEVIIELKAREYDVKDAFRQIMGYFNERENEGKRLFFAASKIDPRLFFPLRHYQEQGKLKFFEVEKDNAIYTTREIFADDFPEPKEIDWSTRRRVIEEDGLIKVTSNGAGRTGRKKKEPRPISSFADLGLESHPFFYQAMWYLAPDYLDKKDYMKPIFISENQKIQLEKLRDTSSLDELFIKFSRLMELAAKYPKHSCEVINLSWATHSDINAFRRGQERITQIIPFLEQGTSVLLRNLQSLVKDYDGDLQQSIGQLSHILGTQEEKIRSLQNQSKLNKYRAVLTEIIRRNLGRDAEIAERNLLGLGFYQFFLLIDYWDLKYERTKILRDIDEGLAVTYFRYFTNAEIFVMGLRRGRIEIHEDKPFDPYDLYELIKHDNELYQNILSNFKVKEEPKTWETKEPSREYPQTVVRPAPVPKKPEPYVYSVRDLTNGSKLKHPSQQVKYCIDTFVKDVLNNSQYSSRIRERVSSLTMRSEWYKHRLSDEKVMDFFNQMTNYVTQDKTPSMAEIRQMIK